MASRKKRNTSVLQEKKEEKMSGNEPTSSVKKKQEEIASRSLPEDVMLNIIARSSVKAILNARSMNKAFYYATYESHFIQKHLERSKREPVLMISFSDAYYERQHFCYLNCDGSSKEIFSKNLLRGYANHDILPPCDGIVCFSGVDGYGLYICNPGMKEFIKFSRSNSLKSAHRSPRYGFAYDTSSDEFKVVNVIHKGEILDGPAQPIRCEIFSLGGRSWHAVDDVCPIPLSEKHLAVPLNNAIHWRISGTSLGPSSPGPIVTFSLETQKFKIIHHPKAFKGNIGDWPFMGKLWGRLCLIDVDWMNPHFLELYILSDYENQKWSMMHIPLQYGLPELCVPICYWKEKIFFKMRWNGYDYIMHYDIQKCILEVSFMGVIPQRFSIFPYYETLISTKKARKRWACRHRKRRFANEDWA